MTTATINPQLIAIKKLVLRLNDTGEKAMEIVQGDETNGKVEALMAAGLAQLGVKPLEDACRNLGVNLAGVAGLDEQDTSDQSDSGLEQLVEELAGALESILENTAEQLGVSLDGIKKSMPGYIAELLQIAAGIADRADAHLAAAQKSA